MEYKPCLSNTDLSMRPIKRSRNGFEHYKYVLLYVDHVLAISDDHTEGLQKIDNYFGLKLGYLSNLNIYLCVNLMLDSTAAITRSH